MPTVGAVLRSMWERCSSFIKKAGTVILIASIVVWFGSVFGKGGFNPDMELEDSILGMFSNAVKWIFAPLGFDDIRATIATIMGLVAKEEVVGVFGVLDFANLTPLAGYSFLAFNLLAAPCFAAIGAIKRDEQREVDLVRHRLSVPVCLRRRFDHLSDRSRGLRRGTARRPHRRDRASRLHGLPALPTL